MANKLVSPEQEPKSNHNKILIVGMIAIVIAILIVGVAICVILLRQQNENMPSGAENEQAYTNVTAISEKQEEVEKVSPGHYELNMNMIWNFPDGDSASTDAFVANNPNNRTDVYFVVTLADTGEEVYTSDIIPLGYQLDEVKLDKHLDKGTYQAVCQYHLVDDAGETLDTLSVTLTLNILE